MSHEPTTAASRAEDVYNEVCEALRRLDKLHVHRSHGVVVLLSNRVKAAAALFDVAPNSAKDAQVRVGIDKNLNIEKLANARHSQGHDAFDNQHRTRL